ncbi:hypothetical protein AABC73_01690 [Pseudomonas sp. G.S.17]|uniref:hypothetical protein n=1 Tax=Pseudomonas sp. G.S.17 TaxID=3137451 RepID=UPI00311CA93F
MSSKNNIAEHATQQLLTIETEFLDTPIANRGEQVFQVVAGIASEDALETAKILSSGLHQLCNNLHDTINMGDLAYCDGVKAMAFLAETVSALIWSVQKSRRLNASEVSQ